MTDNSKIEINPSVLQNRSQTYQSLTDVNGADVFTDDYEEKVKDYQQKEQRSYEDTKEQVFIKKMDENAGKEEAVKEQLFLTAEFPLPAEFRMPESNTHPMMRLLLPAAAAADFLL